MPRCATAPAASDRIGAERKNFQWLILDDSPEPSTYFAGLSDPRVRYAHYTRGKLSIGTKRNWLAGQARADVIAHFDDDDYYAPDYLKTMLGRLDHADITKLSGWFVYAAATQSLGYWDTAHTLGLHFRFSQLPVAPIMLTEENSKPFETHYAGYGFSYVYRKAVWQAAPFPDEDFNEDYGFITAAMAKGFRLDHFADTKGLCLHILRRDNSASCYPQSVFPDFMLLDETVSAAGQSAVRLTP